MSASQINSQEYRDIRNNRKKTQSQNKNQLAFKYYREKNYEKALVIFKELFDKNPTHAYYKYYLNCLIELNDLESAEKIIKKQIRKDEDFYNYYIDLGFVYSLSDKSQKAHRQYQKVLENLPANENMIVRIANSFTYRNQNDLAILTLKKGQEILNNNSLFNMSLGNIYYRTGNFKLMIQAYLDHLLYEPSSLSIIQSRLQLILKSGAGDGIKEILTNELLKRTQKDPEIRIYPEMLYWLSVQYKDFEFALIQAKSIDRRFDKNGMLLFELAELSRNKQEYDVSIKSYNYIINKIGNKSPYYYNSRVGILKSKFEYLKDRHNTSENDILELEDNYLKTLDELGKIKETVPLIRNLANIQAFYLNKLDPAASLLEETIDVINASKEEIARCKIELADIYLFRGEVWEATLLYSQVDKDFKNDPLGHEAKFRNAKLFYYIGEFEWAKTQLNVLRAATSKLIANDAMSLSLLISDNINSDSTTGELLAFSKADLLFYRNNIKKALHILDSLENSITYHPIIDEVLYKKAEIYIDQDNYEKADSLLQIVSTDYAFEILGDDAMFKRAEINEKKLNNKNTAMELYENLFKMYPGSVYAVSSRKRYRELRGDVGQ